MYPTGATPRTDGTEGLRVLSVLTRASAALETARRPNHAPAGRVAADRFPGVAIHESAYVDDGVEIGAGTRIWHFSHILGRTRIGKNVSIGQNVMIGPDVMVGDCGSE
jgi:UDP-3-O-[3-hydroxymyristoyl] glucosamine N-acyltransferase